VQVLAEGCATLRTLELRRCPALTSAALMELAQRVPQLKVLHVGGCSQIDDAGVSAVATCCTQLRSLDVSGCAVRDESLLLLGQCASALEDLNIAACVYLTSEAIREFGFSRTSLRSLTLSRSFGCSSWFTDSLQRELPQVELAIEPAQVPLSLRWHPLPFTDWRT
jgi:hypothetical protein